MRRSDEDGKLVFEHSFSTTNGKWVGSTALEAGRWYSVFIAYDNGSSSNDPSIFVNGVEEALAETAPAGSAQGPTSDLLVIADDVDSHGRFNGAVADLLLADGLTTAAQVLEFIETGDPRALTGAGIDWRFDFSRWSEGDPVPETSATRPG